MRWEDFTRHHVSIDVDAPDPLSDGELRNVRTAVSALLGGPSHVAVKSYSDDCECSCRGCLHAHEAETYAVLTVSADFVAASEQQAERDLEACVKDVLEAPMRSRKKRVSA